MANGRFYFKTGTGVASYIVKSTAWTSDTTVTWDDWLSSSNPVPDTGGVQCTVKCSSTQTDITPEDGYGAPYTITCYQWVAGTGYVQDNSWNLALDNSIACKSYSRYVVIDATRTAANLTVNCVGCNMTIGTTGIESGKSATMLVDYNTNVNISKTKPTPGWLATGYTYPITYNSASGSTITLFDADGNQSSVAANWYLSVGTSDRSVTIQATPITYTLHCYYYDYHMQTTSIHTANTYSKDVTAWTEDAAVTAGKITIDNYVYTSHGSLSQAGTEFYMNFYYTAVVTVHYAYFKTTTGIDSYTVSIDGASYSVGSSETKIGPITNANTLKITAYTPTTHYGVSPQLYYNTDETTYTTAHSVDLSVPYTITDKSYTRYFLVGSSEQSKYTATASFYSGCSGMGTISGTTTGYAGTSVTFKATANSGYEFIGWYDSSGNLKSSSTSYSFTLSSANVTYYAKFQLSPETSYTLYCSFYDITGSTEIASVETHTKATAFTESEASAYHIDITGWVYDHYGDFTTLELKQYISFYYTSSTPTPTLPEFSWAASVSTGSNISQAVTAAKWRLMQDDIDTILAAAGSPSITWTRVSSGDTITAAVVLEMRNAIAKCPGTSGSYADYRSVVPTSAIAQGKTMYATIFDGIYVDAYSQRYNSLKDSLNYAINYYNNYL